MSTCQSTRQNQANQPIAPNPAQNAAVDHPPPSAPLPNNSTLLRASTPKCASRACSLKDIDPIPCKNPACTRFFHVECFAKRYGKEQWHLEENDVCCTKSCYGKIASTETMKAKRFWTNDGKEGLEDPNTSEKVLLDWLLLEGNYSNKWRGKHNGGQKKIQVAASIASLINSSGVVVQRDAKQVSNKIEHFEKQFRKAHDFANSETGAGLQSSDPGSFEDAVKRHCSLYYDLLPVFGDRAGAKPKATNLDDLSFSKDHPSDFSGSFDDDDDDDHQRTVDLLTLKKAAQSRGSNSARQPKYGTGSLSSSSSRKRTNITLFGDHDEHSEHVFQLTASKTRLADAKAVNEEAAAKEKQAIYRQNENLRRMELLEMAEKLHKKHPTWSKERIVNLFPDMVTIIDAVFEDGGETE